MSDECLMKQETVVPFYIVYQAVMRKFSLAGKTMWNDLVCGELQSFRSNAIHEASNKRCPNCNSLDKGCYLISSRIVHPVHEALILAFVVFADVPGEIHEEMIDGVVGRDAVGESEY